MNRTRWLILAFWVVVVVAVLIDPAAVIDRIASPIGIVVTIIAAALSVRFWRKREQMPL